MPLACVRGCTLDGQHAGTCSQPCGCVCHTNGAWPPPCDLGDGNGCYAIHRDATDCTGCLPKPASPGLAVCEGCVWRVTHALAQIPGLIAHLRDNIEPGSATPGPNIKRTKGDAAPAPLNVAAVADADDLHADLASWVLLVLEEHPDHLTGPEWRGSVVRPASKRRDDYGSLRYSDPRVIGTRGDAADTRRLAQWLHARQEWILSQPWADDYVSTLPGRYWETAGRWPTEERAKYLPTPCPTCDRLTLKRYPPTFAGAPVTIACTAHDCRHVIPEEEYGLTTRVVLYRKQQERKEAIA